MLSKPQCTFESPGQLVKMQILVSGSGMPSDSAFLFCQAPRRQRCCWSRGHTWNHKPYKMDYFVGLLLVMSRFFVLFLKICSISLFLSSLLPSVQKSSCKSGDGNSAYSKVLEFDST